LKTIAAIPCFNTVPFIAHVVSGARRYVEQVVVVDDGSTDGTTEAARVAGAEVIKHETRKGAGAATELGFQAAKRSNIIVYFASRITHHPSTFSLLRGTCQ